jgi:hypothetical protein
VKLGVTALGVSALGKKRHRVEVARRLVFGSFVSSHENQKDIFYPVLQSKGNVLFQVLDSSLPWWTERDSWGRWALASPGTEYSEAKYKWAHETQLCLAKIKSKNEATGTRLIMSLSDAVHKLANDANAQSPQKQTRIVALYHSFLLFLTDFKTWSRSSQHAETEGWDDKTNGFSADANGI